MDARGMRTPRRARTTFPSGSSRGCTCSLLLPAAPGSSRCSSQCGSRWTQVRLPVRLPPPSPVRGPQWVPSPAWLPVQPPLPGASPRAMPRGRAWTQAEVGSLLALVGGSGEAALLMASTSRPNEALWQQISRGLAAAGYSRSVAQCRSKWKALKQAFHSERETRRRAGLHSPRLPPHYRAMKSIWKAAGRPVFRERRLLGGCRGCGADGCVAGVELELFLFFQTWGSCPPGGADRPLPPALHPHQYHQVPRAGLWGCGNPRFLFAEAPLCRFPGHTAVSAAVACEG